MLLIRTDFSVISPAEFWSKDQNPSTYYIEYWSLWPLTKDKDRTVVNQSTIELNAWMLLERRYSIIVMEMNNWLLFYTYWDFRLKSIAWKTHTEISSSNHNRETTFSHVVKVFHPIRNQLSKWISQFAVSSRCCWRLFILHSQKFEEFSQVYSSFLPLNQL